MKTEAVSCKFRDSEGLRQRGVHLTCGSTKLAAVRDGDRDTRKLSDVPRGYVRGACNRFVALLYCQLTETGKRTETDIERDTETNTWTS